MITEKEYYEITNCTPTFRIYDFSLKEVQEFLTSLGYKIIIHKAPAQVQMTRSVFGTGEVEKTGMKEMSYGKVLAVKKKDDLPKRNDSEESRKMDIMSVFQKEIKKKILGI